MAQRRHIRVSEAQDGRNERPAKRYGADLSRIWRKPFHVQRGKPGNLRKPGHFTWNRPHVGPVVADIPKARIVRE
jgi:hypothetical protein